MQAIEWLQGWFHAQCDGDWEHELGIRIETLDNPGWKLVIDLADTEQSAQRFEKLRHERSESDWIHCEVRDCQFVGAGGPLNLVELVEVFRAWVESAGLPRE